MSRRCWVKRRTCGRVLRCVPPTSTSPSDAITLDKIDRLSLWLDRGAKQKRLPKNLPIWLTEYGFQTKPGQPKGVTLAQQAAYLKQSLAIVRSYPNVQMFIWFIFRDQPVSLWHSGLLTETAEPAKQLLDVEQIAVVADRGYFKIEDIEACEKAGMEPYVPRPQRGPSVRASLFRKDEFAYDPKTDTVTCPGGQRLSPYSSSVLRGLKKINYVNKQRAATARSARDARTTAFDPSPAWRTRPCSTGCRPGWLSDHRFSRNAATLEHPFGTIKQWMNQGAFLMRGLEKVRGEFSLTALAYNLRRVLNIVRFAELKDAVRS